MAVAAGVQLFRGAFVPGAQPDGNTVVLRGRTGLVVVDTGRHAGHTSRVVAWARTQRLPVQVVVNTHWHLDHVGGNVILRREFPGLRVWAGNGIEGAFTGFLASYRKSLQEQIAAACGRCGPEGDVRGGGGPHRRRPRARPRRGGGGARDATLAGRKLRLSLETHAATATDVQVYDPATRTLVAGDLVTLPVPFFDTACPWRWQEALGRLAAVDFEKLVPGHGPLMTRTDLARYRAAFDGLLACAAGSAGKEQCADGWIAQVGPLVPPEEHSFTRELIRYYLDAHLRGDPARQAALCR